MRNRSSEVARERKQWLVGTITFLVVFLFLAWTIVYYSPGAMVPRFLRGHESKSQLTIYNDGVKAVSRGGRIHYLAQTMVTENQSFRLSGTFDSLLERAENELTADAGWDLQANPQGRTARFYQRSTNTNVTLLGDQGRTVVTLAQTRNATMADRIRKWWTDL